MKSIIITIALLISGSTYALDCKQHAQNLKEAASQVQEAMDHQKDYLTDVFINLEMANSQLAKNPPKESSKAFGTFADVIGEVDQENLGNYEDASKKLSLLSKGIQSLIINCFN